MKRSEMIEAQKRAAQQLKKAGIALTKEEAGKIEVADFGLGELERTGLEIVIYENNDRYCAKELIMFPRQTCPEHKHPPVGKDPGKRETFRVRAGKVWLYVEGAPPKRIKAKPPKGGTYTVFHEIEMKPGDQYTIQPGILHWFQAGPQGAIVSEFSSTSRDEYDIFTDRRIKRIPEIEEDVKPRRGARGAAKKKAPARAKTAPAKRAKPAAAAKRKTAAKRTASKAASKKVSPRRKTAARKPLRRARTKA